jgi:hypothetical protein
LNDTLVRATFVMPMFSIPDSTYRLLETVASARNLLVNAYLAEIASGAGTPWTDSAHQLAALESFTEGMTAWTSQHVPPGHGVDDSRESIYQGRGE